MHRTTGTQGSGSLGATAVAGSAPPPRSHSSSGHGSVQRSPNYKTSLCRNLPNCPYDKHCMFAHSVDELRSPPPPAPNYKSIPCRYFSETGRCNYGNKCKFIHDHSELPEALLTSTPVSSESTEVKQQHFPLELPAASGWDKSPLLRPADALSEGDAEGESLLSIVPASRSNSVADDPFPAAASGVLNPTQSLVTSYSALMYQPASVPSVPLPLLDVPKTTYPSSTTLKSSPHILSSSSSSSASASTLLSSTPASALSSTTASSSLILASSQDLLPSTTTLPALATSVIRPTPGTLVSQSRPTDNTLVNPTTNLYANTTSPPSYNQTNNNPRAAPDDPAPFISTEDAPICDSFEEEFYYSYYYYSYLLGTTSAPVPGTPLKSGRESYYALFPEIIRNVGLGPSSPIVEQTFGRILDWMVPLCEQNAMEYVKNQAAIQAEVAATHALVERSSLDWSLANVVEHAANAATSYHMSLLEGQKRHLSKPLVMPLPLPPPLAQESFANAWRAAHALKISPLRALQLVAYVCAKLSYNALARAESTRNHSDTEDKTSSSDICLNDQARERAQVAAALSGVPRVKHSGEFVPLLTSDTNRSSAPAHTSRRGQLHSLK